MKKEKSSTLLLDYN